MRILLAILAVMMLTACQHTGGAPAGSTDSAAADQKQSRLRFFEPEFAALQEQMLVNLADACVARSSVRDLFDRCLREHVATAFDDSGEGRKQCAFHADFGAFVDCVAMGNTFIDIMRRMTDDSPLPTGFWTGSEVMIRTLSKSIVTKGAASCDDAATGATLNACIDRWFEDHLELAKSLTKRCPKASEDDGRNACLVEAVMVRFMRDHVPRLTAIST